MQLDLFGQTPDQCTFPQLSAATGYRYGCRCRRCTEWKLAGRPTPFCHIEGCDHLRLKGRRYCEEHRPETVARTRVMLEAICEIPGCDRRTSWYESSLQTNIRSDLRDFYRRVCGRHRQPYMGVIKRHHINAKQALELLLITNCSYCGEQLVTLSSGRKDVAVDHDHECCPGQTSCGACVRGFVHPRCNTEIGFLETVDRGSIGLERSVEYLRKYRERERGATLQLA